MIRSQLQIISSLISETGTDYCNSYKNKQVTSNFGKLSI